MISTIIRYGHKIQRKSRLIKANYFSKSNGAWSYHKTKTGNYYLPRAAHEDIVRNTILNNEVFDLIVYETASKYIKPDTIALDIGSNFGQMAIMMSKHVGDRGKVYAFEANKFVYKTLKKNIKANNAPIIPFYGAVHNKADEILHFHDVDLKNKYSTYGSYGVDYGNNKGTPVKTIAIDNIEFDLPISFMKIDIQGGDLFAMQGAIKTIEKHQMPVLFEYETGVQDMYKMCFQDYIDFVESIDYYFARVLEFSNFLILPKNMRS